MNPACCHLHCLGLTFDGSPPSLLVAPASGGVDLGHALDVVVRSLKLEFGQLVATLYCLWRCCKKRFHRLLVPVVGDDITDGVKEGGISSCRFFFGSGGSLFSFYLFGVLQVSWSKKLDVIFIMFGVICTFSSFYNRSRSFS